MNDLMKFFTILLVAGVTYFFVYTLGSGWAIRNYLNVNNEFLSQLLDFISIASGIVIFYVASFLGVYYLDGKIINYGFLLPLSIAFLVIICPPIFQRKPPISFIESFKNFFEWSYLTYHILPMFMGSIVGSYFEKFVK